ncbi:MAG: hypothetical protein IID41_02680 [Planctomycetes bacterium]|nr:hypothetical protein [Planctomycetota bacterium]
MTPIQRYLYEVAQRGIELTPAQGERNRAALFRKIRAAMTDFGRACPTDDDALQEWMEREHDCSWDDIARQPD